jgi:hypothetical protein
VNNREVSKDTEQDLVLALSSYWGLFLKPNLDKVVMRKMLAKNRTIKPEDTKVELVVTERSERNVTKRFDDTNIDWVVIERQLVQWGDLFHAGKKLRVNISFNYNYVESGQPSAISSRKGDKRGLSSTTQRMLAEGTEQRNAEEESSGQPSVWRDVYSLMRCPVGSCNSGPHCWCDPVGKKHYKLRTHHLRSLIQHVEQGHVLQTHDDVPEEIRQQLYTEEQQLIERHQKPSGTSAANCPINITNVLPTPLPLVSSLAGTPASDSISAPLNRLDIPRPRDKAVEDYCAWQQSQVGNPELKAEYQKAYKVIIDDSMDLELIHQYPDPEFLIKGGIKRGAALHIVGDIEDWVKRCKRTRTEE